MAMSFSEKVFLDKKYDKDYFLAVLSFLGELLCIRGIK